MKKYLILSILLSVFFVGCPEQSPAPKKKYPDEDRVSNAQLTYQVMKAAKQKKLAGANSSPTENIPQKSANAGGEIAKSKAMPADKRFAPLPNPLPLLAPITSGERVKPVLGQETCATREGEKFAVPYFKAGNKAIWFRRANNNVREKNGAAMGVIYIDDKPFAHISFWGSNKNGSGYPFTAIKDAPEKLDIDEKNASYTYTKPYLTSDGVRKDFKLVYKVIHDGCIEISWDTNDSNDGVSLWFVFNKNYRGKLISFGEKLWKEHSDELLRSAGKDGVSDNVVGSCTFNGGTPVTSFKLIFDSENTRGNIIEDMRKDAYGETYGWIYRTENNDPAGYRQKGRVRIDFGECAVSKDTPPPVGGLDLWAFDATHVPQTPTRNLMQNPSFEQNERYWRIERTSQRNNFASDFPLTMEVLKGDAIFGEKAMVLRENQWMSSFPFSLDSGKKYTLSFYAKALGNSKTVKATLQNAGPGGNFKGLYRYGDVPNKDSTFKVTDKWQRYSRTFEADAAGIILMFQANNALIDAVQLEEGEKMTDFVCSPFDGNFTTSSRDNDISYGTPIKPVFEVRGKAGTEGKINISLKNLYQEIVFQKTLNVKIGESGFEKIPLHFNDQKIGEGIFCVRADYYPKGGKPYTDYFRFNVMKKLSNTHATKDIFGTGNGLRHTDRPETVARKFMEWGFGSTTWYDPVTTENYLQRKAHQQPITDLFIKYKISNTLFSSHVEDPNRGIVKALRTAPNYRKWTTITPELEKAIELDVTLQLENYPKELMECYAMGNEEEAATRGRYDEYFKIQEVVRRAAKKVCPNLKIAPTHGTSGYSSSRGRDAIDGYIEAAKKHGVIYDAIGIHPYGNYDYDPLWDFDENITYLKSRLKHYGYPDDTPLYMSECGCICDASIPPWKTIWYDDYQGGKLTYDFGNQEIFQACIYARNYLAALKFYPQLRSVNVWTFVPYIDAQLSPLLLCKTVNTLGNLYPDVAYVDDIRPSGIVRGYSYKLKDGTGIAAVWTNNLDVARSRRVCPTMRVKFGQNVEFIDFCGNRRSAEIDGEGFTTIPLTYAPLTIKAKDVKKLTQALKDAEVEDTSNDIQVIFKPSASGVVKADVSNTTTRNLNGKIFIGEDFTRYNLAAKENKILSIGKPSANSNEVGKLYSWNNIYRIAPAKGAGVQNLWKMEYFYIPKCGGSPDWDKIPAIPMNNLLREVGKPSSEVASDASASYKLAWDSENLYLRVEIKDNQFLTFPDLLKKAGANSQLYLFDGAINVYFDTAADGRTKKSYDTNDYRFDFAPPQDGKDGKGYVWRLMEVDKQLVNGTQTSTKEEAAQNIKCQFKRTPEGYTYDIVFNQRYVEPLRLQRGSICAFGICLHDRDKQNQKVIYGSISNSSEKGMHTDNNPQFWPLMILK